MCSSVLFRFVPQDPTRTGLSLELTPSITVCSKIIAWPKQHKKGCRSVAGDCSPTPDHEIHRVQVVRQCFEQSPPQISRKVVSIGLVDKPKKPLWLKHIIYIYIYICFSAVVFQILRYPLLKPTRQSSRPFRPPQPLLLCACQGQLSARQHPLLGLADLKIETKKWNSKC